MDPEIKERGCMPHLPMLSRQWSGQSALIFDGGLYQTMRTLRNQKEKNCITAPSLASKPATKNTGKFTNALCACVRKCAHATHVT